MLLSTSDAAKHADVTRQTVYHWIRLGKLPAEMVAGNYAIRPEDLQTFLRERERKRNKRHMEEGRTLIMGNK